jgi:hypothetical protein
MTAPCAGVDMGDGYDCYGQSVGNNVTPYLSPLQQAALYGKMMRREPLTLTEIAAVRAGVLGADGVRLLNENYGDAQTLPPVNVTTTKGILVLLILFVLVMYYSNKGD